MREHLKRFFAAYTAFVEKQGFAVILSACLGVIVLTAVWTEKRITPLPIPTPPVEEGAHAARLEQQHLAQAMAATPTPAATSAPWQAPLKDAVVLRGFDAARLAPSGTAGLWQLHDAVDLGCDAGTPVLAMRGGTVTACGEDALQGVWLSIDHGEGWHALYAGMALSCGLRTGDPVQAGQTVGFAGSAMAHETDLPPHLHLRVTHNDHAVDPLQLFPK